jgi:5-bromo-4-chloroindolyl phosphate hydrolysis protein
LHEVTEYDIKLVKSPVPYISAGTSWLIWALFFPLYLWYHFIIAALISAGIYLLTSKLFPAKQVKIPLKHRIELSGDAEVDRQIKSARDNVKQIETSVKVIESINPTLAAESTMLISSGCRILAYISKNPERAPLVRRFLNYYLPTLKKLLESYIEFKMHNTAPETVTEIEQTVPAMKDVFQKQIDKLLMDRELDISTDIDVLESKLASDGLINIKNSNDIK